MIFIGLILPWFFLDLTGLLMKIAGAGLIYYGIDLLTKDNEAFRPGKIASLLIFGARVVVLACEMILEPNSQLAVIASLIFMVPETFGMIMVIQTIAEGSMKLEEVTGINLDAEKMKKDSKWYGITAITVLMGTVFATFGIALFSLVFMIASICSLIYLVKILRKIWNADSTYGRWKDSGMVTAGYTVREEDIAAFSALVIK